MRISACLTITLFTLFGAASGLARDGETDRVTSLHKAFLEAKDAKQKSLNGLALGVEFTESQPRVALQYLSNALLKLEPEEKSLRKIIQYHRAIALHRLGNHAEALKVANSLLGNTANKQWTKKLFELKLEAQFLLEDYSGVITTYSRFANQFSLSKREEGHVQMAAQAFAKRGKRTRYLKALETLAEGYPVSDTSRWAFRQLQGYTCEHNGKNAYVFPLALLKKISRNSTLETGLREFILAAISNPIRDRRNRIVELTLKEQVATLIQMRMYPSALQLGTKLYSETHGDKRAHAWATIQVATILNRLGRSLEAMRFYAEFIKDNPKHHYIVKARRGLADTLTPNGLYHAAAEQYYQLTKISNANSYRWSRFWNLYRAEDYTNALALLNKRNYIRPREKAEPSSLDYWKAKVQAKLEQQEASKARFVSVLRDHGASYYSALVLNLYPELQNHSSTMTGSLVPEREAPGGFVRTVAYNESTADFESSETFNFTNPELTLIDDLASVGLAELASIELRGLPWSRYTQSESFFALSRLASLLGEYQPSRKVRYRPQSALRNLPKSWWSLADHQKTFQEEWKVYYPYAFKEIVESQASEFDVKSLLVLSIMRAESRYNVHARSWVGARGLMQIMPYTGVRIARLIGDDNFEVDDLSDPETNIRMGAFYIKRLLNYYRNNPVLAVAAYNAGPIAVDSWLKHCQGCEPDEFVESIPYTETRKYVKKVMRNLVNYERIYNGRQNVNFVRDLPTSLGTGQEMF